MSEPLLDVRDLEVSLPAKGGMLNAVRGMSFSVGPGETLGIVGESGCGKSMTALALLGLLPAQALRRARRLRFDGVDLDALSARAMNRLRGDAIAMIFQEPMTSLNPVFTVGDQLVSVYRRHRGATDAEARKRAVYLLDRVGVTSAQARLKQYPFELSGGMRQRVMIAMALMCGPKLILADEPTTALDVTVQCELLRLLDELRQEFRMAMIFISHDLGVISRMADKVAVMYAGQIVEEGTVEQIFDSPSHMYTRGLLSCLPESAPAGRQGRLPSIPGTIPSLVGDLQGCGFRERCSLAMPRCATDRIELCVAEEAESRNGATHRYRCLLTPEEINRASVQSPETIS